MAMQAADLQATVLCLDDDEAVLELLEAFLPRQGPFDVLTTTDPERGFELVADGTADLVVCDYDMDACTGVHFLERLRANDHELPFVLFTGHGTDEVLAEARSAGAVAAMEKGGADRLASLASTLAAISDSPAGS